MIGNKSNTQPSTVYADTMPQSAIRTPHSPRILIVEDSTVDAQVLRGTLTKAGYAVSVANNGEEALQVARAQRPALVMSDINMPLMNGFQLCRALKYDDELWNIPLILISAMAEPEDIIEAINCGADAYIVKPFVRASLLERLRHLLDTPIERRRAEERRDEVVGYGGRRHTITGSGQQILNLLLSVYENTLHQNRELLTTQSQLQRLNENLDQQVHERTAALLESEQLYRSLFVNARDGIVLIDADNGLVVDCNAEFVKQCGRTKAELKHLHIWELRPAELRDSARRKFEELKIASEGGSSELDFERPDKTRLPIEFASRRIRIGGHDYLQSISRDISERNRSQAAIERERRRLEVILKTANDGIHILDPDGLLVEANDAFLNMLGYDRTDINHLSVFDWDAQMSKEAIRQTIKQLTAHDDTQLIETRHRRSDGQFIDVEITLHGFEFDGQHYVCASSRDISERKRNLDELTQYRHHLEELVEIRTHELALTKTVAEEANAAKSAFVANMSHEIRTPLNAILGFTHLLRHDNHNPMQTEKLDKIVDASRHLLSVINDILDFSKIEAGKLSLNVSDFAFDRMLDNVVSMIAPKAHDKQLELVVEKEPLPPVLLGDATRLAQALLNYLSNAVKFTERGKITVRLRKTEESANDLLVRFEVTDTGIGIPPDRIANLFAAFEQVDVTTSRRYGGTGLGLAINRRLAHLMGGETGAESVPGQGSSFWFTARLGKSKLCLEEISRAPFLTELSLQAIPSGMRILLAEDNRINQEVARALLRKIGLQVETANDGLESLKKAGRERFDLILMDMQMPGMDGLEATRAIRALPGYATLPIVAMTANVFDEDRERCIAAGMNDFLTKPIDPEQLFGTLLRWLPSATPMTSGTPVTIEMLPASLSAIPGLDTGQGLKTLGSLDAYLRLLRQYALEHADDMTRMRQHIGTGDRDTAKRLVHTLKSNSGSMGATRVQHQASELDSAFKSGCDASEIERLASALESELRQVTAAILAALPAQAATPYVGDVDWARVREVLDELEPLLAASNIRANQIFERHAALIEAALAPLSRELKQRIEHFLYPESLATLQQARQEYLELAG